jgi:hypothetical protein
VVWRERRDNPQQFIAFPLWPSFLNWLNEVKQKVSFKIFLKLGMVVHACNSRTWEAEAGRLQV